MKATFLATGALVAVVSSALPVYADDELPGYSPPHVVEYSGGEIPPYAHLENRTNTKVILPGLAVLAVPYGFSVLYALSTCGAQTDCRSGSQWLYVPVVGPFITAGLAPTSGGEALSVFDGALQLGGAALAVAGLLMPRSVVVWQDPRTAVGIAPTLTAGGEGVAITVTSM